MKLGNVARVALVAASFLAAAGSGTSNNNNAAPPQAPQEAGPPQPQQMDAQRALGLWRTTFGAVKIEADNAHGGLQSGAVQGVWEYTRQGADVIGYFFGTLQGNVLRFKWQEPATPPNPPLSGEGFLVFEQSGRQYQGRWWSDQKDRSGDWNGWRQDAAGQSGYPQQPQQGYPQQPQYPQQGNPQQGNPPPPPPDDEQGGVSGVIQGAPQPPPQQPPAQPQQPPPQQPPAQPYY